jgi:DNA-binding beta-propeller fold protein YncE
MKISEKKWALHFSGAAGVACGQLDAGLKQSGFTLEAWVRPAAGEIGIRLFDQARYLGKSRLLKPGRYDDLSRLGVSSIASIQISPGLCAMLFDQEDCSGAPVSITADSPQATGALVTAKSMLVFDNVRGPDCVFVCPEKNPQTAITGQMQALPPGVYPDLKMLKNPKIGALVFSPGMMVVLYEKAGLQGDSVRLIAPVGDVSDIAGWKKTGQSMVISQTTPGPVLMTNIAGKISYIPLAAGKYDKTRTPLVGQNGFTAKLWLPGGWSAGLQRGGASVGQYSASTFNSPAQPITSSVADPTEMEVKYTPPKPANQAGDRMGIFDNGKFGLSLDLAAPRVSTAPLRMLFAGAELRRDKWHHLALLWDGATMKAMLDGQVIQPPTALPVPDLSGDWMMGNNFRGDIGLVRLRKGILTDKVVAQGRFDVPAAGSPDLALAWTMEEGSTSGVITDLGQKRVVTVVPTAWTGCALPVSPIRASLAHTLHCDVEQYNSDRLHDARADVRAKVEAAHNRGQARIAQAHTEAIASSQIAGLDFLSFVYGGRLQSVGPDGKRRNPVTDNGYLSDTMVDVINKTTWVSRRSPKGGVGKVSGAAIQWVYEREQPVWALAIDPTGADPSKQLAYWIEGSGNSFFLCSARMDGMGAVHTLIPVVPGRDGEWDVDVDSKKRRIYWSNGREIWYRQAWYDYEKPPKLLASKILGSYEPPKSPMDEAKRVSAGGVAVSPDGSRVFVVVGENIIVLKADTLDTITQIKVGNTPMDVAVSPDGTYLYVTHWEGDEVTVLNASNLATGVIEKFKGGKRSIGIAVSPDGSRIFVVHSENLLTPVTMYDAWSKKPIKSIHMPSHPQPLGYAWFIAATRDSVFVPHHAEGSIFRFDAQTLEMMGKSPYSPQAIGRAMAGVAVTPDGTQILVADSRGSGLWVHDAQSLEMIGQPIEVGVKPVMVKDGGGPQKIGTAGLAPLGVAVDQPGQRLFVTCGGIGQADVIKVFEMSAAGFEKENIAVSHGRSPHPLVLAVDDDSGALVWLDRELEQVRRCESDFKEVHNLYDAAGAREALALDRGTKRLYWNSEFWQRVDAAVIEQPGLFCWFQDRGDRKPGHQHQHVPVLDNVHLIGVRWAEPKAWDSRLDHISWAATDSKLNQYNLSFDGIHSQVAIYPRPIMDDEHVVVSLGFLLKTFPTSGVVLIELGDGTERLVATAKGQDFVLRRWTKGSDQPKEVLFQNALRIGTNDIFIHQRDATTVWVTNVDKTFPDQQLTIPRSWKQCLLGAGSNTEDVRFSGEIYVANIRAIKEKDLPSPNTTIETSRTLWRNPRSPSYKDTWGNIGDGNNVDWLGQTAGKVLHFDGLGEHIDPGPIYLDCHRGFTMTAWVRFNSRHADYGSPSSQVVVVTPIIDLGNGTARDNIIVGLASPSGLALQVYFGDTGYHKEVVCSLRGNRNFGGTDYDMVMNQYSEWAHIAATIDGSGTGRIYINGVKGAEGKVGVPNTALRTRNYIGQTSFLIDQGFPDGLDGQIGSLRIWNEGLSEDAIKAQMGAVDTKLPEIPYHRSLLNYGDGHSRLVAGSLDGVDPAVPLFDLAADGGLSLLSKGAAAHDKLVQAHRAQDQARQERAAKVAAEHRKAAADTATAHTEATQKRASAAKKVADARTDAARKRANAHAQLKAAADKAVRQKQQAKDDATQRKADATAKAEQLKTNALNEKQRQIADANADLARAQAERAKH